MINDQDGNRQQLELFLEHTAVVAWLKDETGRLVFASNNYLRRFAWTREYAYGKTEYELWPEPEADCYRKNDLKLLTEPGPIDVIEKATAADGSVSWWFGSKFLFSDENGQRFFGGVAVDITSCKQSELLLAESDARYQALLDGSSDWIWTRDLTFKLSYSNHRSTTMLGFCAKELFEFAPAELIHPDDQAKLHSTLHQAVLTKNGWRGLVLRWRTKNDSYKTLESNASAIFNLDGELIGFHGIDRDISKRAATDTADRLRSNILDSMPKGIVLTRIRTKSILYTNPQFDALFGYAAGELVGQQISTINATTDKSPEGMTHYIIGELEKSGVWSGEVYCQRKDGSKFWTFTSVSNFIHPQYGPVWLSVSDDITERKLVENDLRIAAIAFESQEGMTVTDASGTILRVNRAFTEITGYIPEEIIGKNPRFLRSGKHDTEFYGQMWQRLLQDGAWEGEIWNRRKNGEVYPEYLIITAVRDSAGRITNYVATFNDITLSKAAADEIQNLAFYDPLTLLPNRRLLLDRIKQALAASVRNETSGTILFIDLDHFKMINDTLGHSMGDLLLQQVAQRLSSCVRETDTVARLGGDEFVVMLERLSKDTMESATQAEIVAKKILTALNQTYHLGTHEFRCAASIGATQFHDHQISQDELLKQADIAMYQAKTLGRNTICFFDPQMQTRIAARAVLENELHKVLGQHQLHLYYQVQVDQNGQAVGAEALLRWHHPQRGIVAPGQFIPVAEESGLILPIGQWVLENGCARLSAWQDDPLTEKLELAINVSARQFHQAEFVTQVEHALQHHAINPRRLKLELTESMLIDKTEETIKTIQALKDRGIQFSLDDFGTGYSSLQYLKRLPLDQLKIDQSFVHDLAENSSDQAIVQTIIAMAHSLNLDVIAEGVETDEQHAILLSKGCTRFQGYLFGRPIPIDEFELALRSQALQ
jgi:diguanylate cyclase (GGDEF)-like protein/PAS domain S-box-containing protein